ncbi:unnamed protein product [Colias eurytheme]|nr:unnamed protein product [Colias eurytheme]
MNGNNLKIGFLNPGSLGTGHEEFIVAVGRHNVDILALNETWLRAGEEGRAPRMPGYRLKHIPRPVSIRNRGDTMNLNQYVTEPTHFVDETQTLLDLVCSNSPIKEVIVDYIPSLSHHAFICSVINVKKEKPVPRWITFRPLKDIDFVEFNRFVSNINLDFIRCLSNVNEMILWKHIKDQVNIKESNDADLPLNICDPDEINNHFLNVPGNGDIQRNIIDNFIAKRYQDSDTMFHFTNISEENVIQALKALHSNAMGVDGISLDMLRKLYINRLLCSWKQKIYCLICSQDFEKDEVQQQP